MENKKLRRISAERLCDTGFSFTLSFISRNYELRILDMELKKNVRFWLPFSFQESMKLLEK